MAALSIDPFGREVLISKRPCLKNCLETISAEVNSLAFNFSSRAVNTRVPLLTWIFSGRSVIQANVGEYPRLSFFWNWILFIKLKIVLKNYFYSLLSIRLLTNHLFVSIVCPSNSSLKISLESIDLRKTLKTIEMIIEFIIEKSIRETYLSNYV